MSAPYEAVILAAGRGSRLGDETGELPKSILPIGRRAAKDPTETTFLRRQVELLGQLGVEKVVVVIGYLRDQMAAEIESWAPWARLVVNPTPEIQTSGSLHSFQYAARSPYGVLDGTHQTLLMDADIVYHRDVLALLLASPERSTALVCDQYQNTDEEVLVYGTDEHPRLLGKGVVPAIVGESPCLGEATGIVKLAPADHAAAREIMDWLLGDPNAPEGSLQHRGFGPGRRATEHEELTQWLMHVGRMTALRFDGARLPFMEVDTKEEYRALRTEMYPRILEMGG